MKIPFIAEMFKVPKPTTYHLFKKTEEKICLQVPETAIAVFFHNKWLVFVS
jgi:hypothetical protein